MSTYEFENFLIGIVHETKTIDKLIESMSITGTSIVKPDVRTEISNLRDRWSQLLDNLYDPSFRTTGESKKWLVDLKSAIADWRSESLGNFANDYITVMCATRSANSTILKAINDGKGSLVAQVVSSASSLGDLYDQWITAFPASLKAAVIDPRDSVASKSVEVYDQYMRDCYAIDENSLVSFAIGNVVSSSDLKVLRLFDFSNPAYTVCPMHGRSVFRSTATRGSANAISLVFNDDEKTAKSGVVFDCQTAASPPSINILVAKTGGFTIIANFLEKSVTPVFGQYSDITVPLTMVDQAYTLQMNRTTNFGLSSAVTTTTDQLYNKVVGQNKEIVFTIPEDANDSIVYTISVVGLPALSAGSAIIAGIEITSVSFASDSGVASVLIGNTNAANSARAFKTFLGTCSYPLVEKSLPVTVMEGLKLLRQYNLYLEQTSSGYDKTISNALTPDWQKLSGSNLVLDERVLSISYWLSPTPDLGANQKQILYSKWFDRVKDYLRAAAIDGAFHDWIASGY